MQTVTLEVAFVLRAEIVVVAAAPGVSERRAEASLSVEKETGDEGPAITGGFRLHAGSSNVDLADFLFQSCNLNCYVEWRQFVLYR